MAKKLSLCLSVTLFIMEQPGTGTFAQSVKDEYTAMPSVLQVCSKNSNPLRQYGGNTTNSTEIHSITLIKPPEWLDSLIQTTPVRLEAEPPETIDWKLFSPTLIRELFEPTVEERRTDSRDRWLTIQPSNFVPSPSSTFFPAFRSTSVVENGDIPEQTADPDSSPLIIPPSFVAMPSKAIHQAPTTSPEATAVPEASQESETEEHSEPEENPSDYNSSPKMFKACKEPFIERLYENTEEVREELIARKKFKRVQPFCVPEFAPVIESILTGLQTFFDNDSFNEKAMYGDFKALVISEIKEKNYPYHKVLYAALVFSALSEFYYYMNYWGFNNIQDSGLRLYTLTRERREDAYSVLKELISGPEDESVDDLISRVFPMLEDYDYHDADTRIPEEAFKDDLDIYIKRTLKDKLGPLLADDRVLLIPTFQTLTMDGDIRIRSLGLFPITLSDQPGGFEFGVALTSFQILLKSLKYAKDNYSEFHELKPDSDNPEWPEYIKHLFSAIRELPALLSASEAEVVQAIFFYYFRSTPASIFQPGQLPPYVLIYFSLRLMFEDFERCKRSCCGIIAHGLKRHFFSAPVSRTDILKGMLFFMSLYYDRDPEASFHLDTTKALAFARINTPLLAALWQLPMAKVSEFIRQLELQPFYISWLEKRIAPDIDSGMTDSGDFLQRCTNEEPRGILLWLLLGSPAIFDEFVVFFSYWLDDNAIKLNPDQQNLDELIKWRSHFNYLDEGICEDKDIPGVDYEY